MISVIIPVREGGNPAITLKSLAAQTYKDFEVIVSWDHKEGANKARNRGASLARGEYLLFSDDDIEWRPTALVHLHQTLLSNPKASYAYGAYKMGTDIYCNRVFDAGYLKKLNYISTMSLIHKSSFPGFDESLYRLQDWDLWLTMLRRGHVGAYTGSLLFETQIRKGITFENGFTWQQARNIVAAKHGLDERSTVNKIL